VRQARRIVVRMRVDGGEKGGIVGRVYSWIASR
jgi:hypothetical protein